MLVMHLVIHGLRGRAARRLFNERDQLLVRLVDADGVNDLARPGLAVELPLRHVDALSPFDCERGQLRDHVAVLREIGRAHV
jgi:hypothetical protein